MTMVPNKQRFFDVLQYNESTFSSELQITRFIFQTEFLGVQRICHLRKKIKTLIQMWDVFRSMKLMWQLSD